MTSPWKNLLLQNQRRQRPTQACSASEEAAAAVVVVISQMGISLAVKIVKNSIHIRQTEVSQQEQSNVMRNVVFWVLTLHSLERTYVSLPFGFLIWLLFDPGDRHNMVLQKVAFSELRRILQPSPP
jgi:hypothetical protein